MFEPVVAYEPVTDCNESTSDVNPSICALTEPDTTLILLSIEVLTELIVLTNDCDTAAKDEVVAYEPVTFIRACTLASFEDV